MKAVLATICDRAAEKLIFPSYIGYNPLEQLVCTPNLPVYKHI